MWTYFNLLMTALGQRLSGIYTMVNSTGRSLLYEALNELKSVAGVLRLTGDLQAVNAAVSGGADETYMVVLGKPGVIVTAIMGYVRNKAEVAAGPAFQVCSVAFGWTDDDFATTTLITADTSLSGESTYLEIDPTVLTSIPATAVFYAQVTVPAAVTVALGLDLDVQR